MVPFFSWILGYENPNIDAKLESVFGRDWYTQRVESSKEDANPAGPKQGRTSKKTDDGEDGRKRLKSVDVEAEKKEMEAKQEKLKSLFEESAWWRVVKEFFKIFY